MKNKRERLTMVTSAAPANIRCSCSTRSVTLSGVRCAPAMFIAPTAGATFWNLSSSVIGNGTCAAISGGTPLLPRLTFINFWNQAKRHMRKFNGVPKAQFGLHLKKCEWRFNNSDPMDKSSQICLLYTSPSPRDVEESRMPSSA